MTKISNLYSLTNYITASTSGNIVISAPSSGYALDVTGTGRFTSTLTANAFTMPASGAGGSTTWNFYHDQYAAGDFSIWAGSTSRLLINAAGNVGIGTTSPSQKLSVGSITSGGIPTSTPTCITLDDTFGNNAIGTNFKLKIFQDNATNRYGLGVSDSLFEIAAGSGGGIGFFTNGASERARINPSGYFKASPNGTYINGATSTFHSLENNTTDVALYAYNSFVGNGNVILARGYSNNTSGSLFLGYSSSIGDYTIRIYSNGNIQNATGSYGALSDIKLKENIVDAASKLNDLLQVRVVNYNLKSNPELKQIGVIAQELEEIFPGMVEETVDKDECGNDLETTTKSVKYSVFIPMLIKAVQELSAKVTALENK